MTNEINPFQAPQAIVDDLPPATTPARIFAVSGRLNRLRYIAYSTGLPLLTLSQRAFASRMAGSLLRAVGLAELVTESPAAYVEAACALAANPERLGRLRAVLAGDAWSRSLGDGARFTAELEAAYRSIRRRPA